MSLREFRVPAFCPICTFTMKGKSTNTYYDYGCCIDCYIWFLEDRPEKQKMWKEGWRPSTAQLAQYKEMMKQ
jgi:hypothetical protein